MVGLTSPQVSRQLAECGQVFAASPSSSRSCAPVMPGPGQCHRLGEVGPPAIPSGVISRHGDRHLSGEGVSFQGLDVSFLGLGGQVSCSSFSSEDVAAAVVPHGIVGAFSSQRSLLHVSS